jgi:hypothetical protein
MFYPPPLEDRYLRRSRRSRRKTELFVIPEISAKFEFTEPDETPSEISDADGIDLNKSI